MADQLELATPARRKRSFVAAPRVIDLADKPATVASTLDDDDIPVLTEVVLPEPAEAAVAEIRSDGSLVATVAAEVVQAIEQQLAIELPMLIEAALLNAGEELRGGINTTIEVALRDFLARRRELARPVEVSTNRKPSPP